MLLIDQVIFPYFYIIMKIIKRQLSLFVFGHHACEKKSKLTKLRLAGKANSKTRFYFFS